MNSRLAMRCRIEMALAVLSAILLMLTITVPDWIERFFGIEPDGGNGSTEWSLAITLAIATITLFADARRLRMRLRSARASAASK